MSKVRVFIALFSNFSVMINKNKNTKKETRKTEKQEK